MITNAWNQLTRPRNPPWSRRTLAPRRRRSGVALVLVIGALTVLTVLVTELAYLSRVQFVITAHQRDREQAYWLARSGSGLYRLILVANAQLANNEALSNSAEMFGINLGDALWQMVPFINTGIIRMLVGSGGDVDDIDDETMEEFNQTGEIDEDVREESREGGLFSDQNFLDFEGDFSAEVEDQESRININALSSDTNTVIQDAPVGQLLYAMMSGDENDQWFYDRNIDRWEIIGNLKDWVDADTFRSGGLGGYEDNLYNMQDPPYMSKNAAFDTLEEIRLVEGWQDDVFERFGDKVTIWGSGTININTCSDEVMKGVIRAYSTTSVVDSQLDTCVEQLRELQLLSDWNGGKDFADSVMSNCGLELDNNVKTALTSSSKTFTVTSTGLVGSSAVTITTVYDFSSESTGKVVYWRVD